MVVSEPSSLSELKPATAGELDVHTLPHAPYDDWSDRWLAMIRLLEENAPCTYLSCQDWTAACITPRLSNRVIAVGILHDASVPEQEHCFRLGRFWNAVVAVDPRMRQRVMVEHQSLAARLAPIHADDSITVRDSAFPYRWDTLADEYVALSEKLENDIRTGRFVRPRGKMATPPASAYAEGTIQTVKAIRAVNVVPTWPDFQPPGRRAPDGARPDVRSRSPQKLEDHRIVFAIPTGRISGVDIFAINLATELLRRDYRAEIVQSDPPDRIFDALPIVSEIPVHKLQLREQPTWPERWRAMRNHLEERSPCIYVPNYDTRHSAIVPTLSAHVKSIGIAHSDDPQHYDHIARLSHWWDGVVGVSDQITRTVEEIVPELGSRITTIPYGVRVPARSPEKARGSSGFLRAVYAGRITRYQKRTLDLVSVAEILQCRDAPVEITIIGNGPDAPALIQAMPALATSRRIRWVGSISNEQVLDVFANSDVFVLPSSFEGLPVSLLEAMAHGCVPVVYGIRSGIPDVIQDGVNGFVVPIGDVEAMAEKLQLLERDELLLRRMRAAAHQTVRDSRFEISSMTEAYIEFFERVLAEPRKKTPGRIVKPPELSRLDAHMPRLPMGLRKSLWGAKKIMGLGGSNP